MPPRRWRGCNALYDGGADPVLVLQDLLELTHFLTRLKLAPAAGENDPTLAAMRARGRALAGKLGMPVLTRTWQMLLRASARRRRRPRLCKPPRWCWCASPTSPSCRRRATWSRR